MAKEKIPKSVRNAVWNLNIGDKKEGYCFVGCGEKISVHNFACGHIISEKNGGKVSIDNLKPVCIACNSSMGRMNMHDFIKKYGFNKHNDVINENIYSVKPQKHNFQSNLKFLTMKRKISKTDILCKNEDGDENSNESENDDENGNNNENGDEDDFNLKSLKIKELRYICDYYRMPYKKNYNKAELIKVVHKIKKFNYNNYLRESLKDFKINKLKNICVELELPKHGRKKDLIDKIIKSDTIIEISDYIDDNEISNNKYTYNENSNIKSDIHKDYPTLFNIPQLVPHKCGKCLNYGHDTNHCTAIIDTIDDKISNNENSDNKNNISKDYSTLFNISQPSPHNYNHDTNQCAAIVNTIE